MDKNYYMTAANLDSYELDEYNAAWNRSGDCDMYRVEEGVWLHSYEMDEYRFLKKYGKQAKLAAFLKLRDRK